ncbi:MAG: YhbY family RNA-binding protein [Christensenellaceae bacterium]|jgi:RNA-binding protein|nr:YhbY family RNA-binding protein [Christensenellaceae bacterium]
MTGKQRAALRSMCNTLAPVLQIGKGGVNEAFIAQLDEALEARELVKVTVLETAGIPAREASAQLCAALHAEPVQCIGRKLSVYRRSENNPKIEL